MTRAANWNGALPDGGVSGAVLVKKSGATGDVDWSTAGVVSPASPVTFTQTYSTTATTVPAATAVAPAATGATNSSPYGYTGATQADAIVTAVIALIADVLAVRKTQNQIIDILQAAGLAL